MCPRSRLGSGRVKIGLALFFSILQALSSRRFSISLSEIIPYQPMSIPSFTLSPSVNRPLVGSEFLDKGRPSPAVGPCCGWSSLAWFRTSKTILEFKHCSLFTLVTGLSAWWFWWERLSTHPSCRSLRRGAWACAPSSGSLHLE